MSSVENHTASTEPTVKRTHGNLFMDSFSSSLALRDEAEEQTFLKGCVIDPVATAGQLPDLESNASHPSHGVTDFNIRDNVRVRIVVKIKASHSLPLPMNAEAVVDWFNNGRIDAVSEDANK